MLRLKRCESGRSLLPNREEKELRFEKYRPREGDPDLNECLQEARELSYKIADMILKDSEAEKKDKLQTLKRQTMSYESTAHNYLINRKRYREGNHNFRPLYAIWTTLNNCNFSCKYCDNHQGGLYPEIPDPDRLNTEQAKKLLKIMRTGTSSIYWCGGEPTLRNDLPELLDYACDLGFFPNIINTNGTMFHKRLLTPQWRKFLYQMDIIVVSMDGLNLQRLDELWVTKESRRVFVNLLLLRELQKLTKFKLAVNCVIMPDAIEEARAVFDLACDLDIWFVPVPVNVKHEPNKQLINNQAYKELANLILTRKDEGYKIIGSKGLLQKLLYAEPYQCLTTLKPHIWSNGKIAYPCRASHNIPPVDINLLDYETFDDAYEAGRKLINPDNFHGKAANQCGGDCAWMQNYTTARYGAGLSSFRESGLIGEITDFILKR